MPDKLVFVKLLILKGFTMIEEICGGMCFVGFF